MKIYISGCTRTEKRMIAKTADLLESAGHLPSFYALGTPYSRENLEQSDAAVFILPDGSFECPISHMTQGSLKELVYCINNRKDIYISYESQSGLRMYAAEITDNLCIKGITATYMNLDTIGEVEDILRPENSKTEESSKRFY